MNYFVQGNNSNPNATITSAPPPLPPPSQSIKGDAHDPYSSYGKENII